MKVLLLYRPNSEHSRIVENFAREFSRVHPGHKVELVSLDTRDGSSMATLYDVMSYPAILALGTDGRLIKEWEGESLPLMNEVAYYSTI